MKNKRFISWGEVFSKLAPIDFGFNRVYGVPKGGMIAASFLKHAEVTHTPDLATIILDDVVDSGNTREIYKGRYPNKEFIAMFDNGESEGNWLVFPWEAEHPGGAEDNIQQNIIRELQYIGEDVNRQGLKGTPDRIVASWKELFAGYNQDPSDLFTVFDTGGYDQIILLKDIELFSMCEHHWLPFFGKAHVAYIPGEKIIGISKLARLVDVFARRFQIQERIGQQVTETLMEYLKPVGAACVIEAVHMCMRMRGCEKQHSTMVTSSLKGVFLEQGSARSEFLELIK